MRNRYKIWENTSLVLGGLGIAIFVIGLGYTLSDRVFNSISHQQVTNRQINKPVLVKSDIIHHVRIDLNGNTDDIASIEQALTSKGYEVYVPKGTGDIQVGAFKDLAKAQALAKKLNDDGLETKID